MCSAKREDKLKAVAALEGKTAFHCCPPFPLALRRVVTLLRRSTSWRFASSCSGVNRFLLVAHGWLVGTAAAVSSWPAVGIWSPSPTVIRRRARAASIASSLNSGAGEVRMPDMTPVGDWEIHLSLLSANKSIHGPQRALTFVEAVAIHVSIIRKADAAVDKAVHGAEAKRGVRCDWARDGQRVVNGLCNSFDRSSTHSARI